jgi:hypothetical protein
MERSRRLTAASVWMAALLVVGGCGPEIKADELGALPEATLVPEGAVILSSGGFDGHWGPDGDISSTWKTSAGVPQSIEEINAFYHEALSGRDWEERGMAPFEDEAERWTWERGDYSIQISVKNAEYFERIADEHPDWSRYGNMIQITILAYDRTESVPP